MLCYCVRVCGFFFFSSRRRHTRCALVTGVQTCALPIWWACRGISALRPRYSCSDGELLALAAAAADGRLPAEADLLRELAALLGIIWRDHGIVGRQPPLRPVLVRGHLIVGQQVAFQHFALLAVLQTDAVRSEEPRVGKEWGGMVK